MGAKTPQVMTRPHSKESMQLHVSVVYSEEKVQTLNNLIGLK